MTETPIWGHQLEEYINIGTTEAPTYEEVGNLLNWTPSNDQNTYEPDYIDQKVSPTYVTGTKCDIEFEKDAYNGSDIDKFFTENEEKSNLPTSIVRVYGWIPGTTEGTFFAKEAAFSLAVNPLSNDTAGEPIKISGSLSRTDADWTDGEWNPTTKKFTPATEAASGE